MITRYTAPRKASWLFIIYPQDRTLVEPAPYDEDTRAIYQLAQPVRDWLAENRHTLDIDRGDFGEGAEHFHITITSKALADEFKALCESLS